MGSIRRYLQWVQGSTRISIDSGPSRCSSFLADLAQSARGCRRICRGCHVWTPMVNLPVEICGILKINAN